MASIDDRDNDVKLADGTSVDVPIIETDPEPQVESSNMADSVSRSDFEFLDREGDAEFDKPIEQDDVEEEGDEEDEDEDEYGEEEESVDEEDSEDDFQIPYGPTLLPMPDLTEFSVPLPDSLIDEPADPVEPPAALAPLPDILHVPTLLESYELDDPSPSLQGLQVFHLGRKTRLTGEMQAMYLRLPPGTRMSRENCFFFVFRLLKTRGRACGP